VEIGRPIAAERLGAAHDDEGLDGAAIIYQLVAVAQRA
jgi:hypothetical protein